MVSSLFKETTSTFAARWQCSLDLTTTDDTAVPVSVRTAPLLAAKGELGPCISPGYVELLLAYASADPVALSA
jgi:hypothetical protein